MGTSCLYQCDICVLLLPWRQVTRPWTIFWSGCNESSFPLANGTKITELKTSDQNQVKLDFTYHTDTHTHLHVHLFLFKEFDV